MKRRTRVKNAIQAYDKACMDIVREFEQKQGLHFEHWVGGEVGGIAAFGCVFFFSMQNMVEDLLQDVPKGLVIEWLYAEIEQEKSINYSTFLKGLRHNMLDTQQEK